MRDDVRFLVVHHSASRNGHTGKEVPHILKDFYDLHTSPEKGWADIAYNFVIDSDGGVWEGRAGSLLGPVAGDATGGNQGFSQLVCLIGDYGEVEPRKASLNSLVLLLAWLAGRYRIETTPGSVATFTSRGSSLWPAGAIVTTPTITGHRTMSDTSCPGDALNRYVVGSLLADVHARRAALAGATTTTPVSVTGPSVQMLEAATPVATKASVVAAPLKPPKLGRRIVGAGAVIAAGTGLAVWRQRRME